MMKEQKRKEKKEIVVLDNGIDTVESYFCVCCTGAFIAIR